MKRSHVLVVVLLILGFLLFLTYPKILSRMGSIAPSQNAASASQFATPLLHQYRKGAHIYIGAISVPTPCHFVTSEALVRESYPEQVTINVAVQAPTETCSSENSTLKKFKVAFQASKEAVVAMTLNGVSAVWTSTEAPSDSNLEITPID